MLAYNTVIDERTYAYRAAKIRLLKMETTNRTVTPPYPNTVIKVVSSSTSLTFFCAC